MATTGENIEAALSLARAGYHVFPCHSGGEKAKQPMPFIKWPEASTNDQHQIRKWWAKWPDAVPGLDLAKSGLIVIDCDRHGEHDGVTAFGDLMAANGHDPDASPIVATPNEGNHLFFRQPLDRRMGNRRGNLPAGVDVRGSGGYVIAPGSVMADGRVYELHGDIANAPTIPAWLMDLIDPPVSKESLSTPPPTFVGSAPAHDGPASLDELRELLGYVSASCDYHTWFEVLAAIHAETGGSAEGLALADEWSTSGHGYPGTAALAKKWKSFRSTGLTGRTIARYAQDGGADLSAIAIRHGKGEYAYYEYDPVEAAQANRDLWDALQRKSERQAIERAQSELEWFDDVRPVVDSPYMIKGFLDRGSMSVIYGPSNSGKTFFALDVAFHIALDSDGGSTWRDRRVSGGAVLYLAAEGGNGIANRIAGLRETTGACDVPFALRRAGLDLLNPRADTAHVIALAQEVSQRGQLVLIVIDTLSRVIAGGDENAAQDMTAFIRNVDAIRAATGAHIMIVHHTGKDAAKGARGHSSLRAATDTEVEVSVDEFDNRAARVTKQRDHEGGETFTFSLKPVHLGMDQDGDEVTTCVVEAIEERKSEGMDLPPRETCEAILEEIQIAWNSGNPYSMAPQSKSTGRYAPRALSQKFRVKMQPMERLLTAWIDNEILLMDIRDNHTKKRGLTVIGTLS